MSDFQIANSGMSYWKLVKRDGQVVAVLSQTTQNRWIICDPNDKRICNQTFPTTGAAKKWLVENGSTVLP